MEQGNKIDLVILWVDGSDPNWQNKLASYKNNGTYFASRDDSRYRDYDTLKFLFRSIEKYVPWVNHIFLVTDDQQPSWFKANEKVTIVDHRDFLNHEFLPVFNSNAIELGIYRISNLAEQFIYLNDDCLFNQKLEPRDFFLHGKPKDIRVYRNLFPEEDFDNIVFNNIKLLNRDVIKRKWPLSRHGLLSWQYKKQLRYNLMQLSRKSISAFYDPHGPIAFTKKDFKRAWSIWPREFSQTETHRFREFSDVSIWLIRYLRLELGEFEPQKVDFNQFYTIHDVKAIRRELSTSMHATICINDSLSKDYEIQTAEIDRALAKKFPEKSIYEL